MDNYSISSDGQIPFPGGERWLGQLAKMLEKFGPDTLITMTFRKCHFSSGHDLKDFAGKLEIELQQGDVEQ